MKVYTGGDVRELDRCAIEDHQIPGIALMKRAGRATFDAIVDRWPRARSLSVVCGTGNNGGDGYVVAGLAREAAYDVELVQVGERRLEGDAALARDWALALGVEPVVVTVASVASSKPQTPLRGDVVVDALLGTGMSGSVRPHIGWAIAAINNSGRPVVAVDIPSGICADTGACLGTAVQADLTVTFVAPKIGLVTGAGVDYVGELVYDTLGVPEAVFASTEGVRVVSADFAPKLDRPRSAHKNRFGHVLILGGDSGFGGAVMLAGEAALRTGAGLVSVATRPEHRVAVLSRRPELMVRGVDEGTDLAGLLEAANVVAIGPGLGRGPWGEQLLYKALASGKPLVVDADALNILAGKDWCLPAGSITTPHPGEAARLLGIDAAAVEANRIGAVREIANKLGAVAVLKGAGTLIAEVDGSMSICLRGNPGMATAGSGDVLTGIIAALLAQGLTSREAADAGVWLHAAAGDAAVHALAPQRLVASDLIAYLFHEHDRV
ncbi:MAG: NAD(P)H-hydrate dehydratase [Gammaproteobacteria bacterium]|nr:NAD(P)H-hydrate dehydratase [Gammaproteobacteria bacterium]